MTDTARSPKYLDVSAVIEAQIQTGRWDGGKMPSVRWVAQHHQVSAVTASRALQVLRDKGLVRTVERAGCFRIPAPAADRWAIVRRPTPGPGHAATTAVAGAGFEALARREPMHVETGLFPLAPGATAADVDRFTRRAKELGVRGVFLLPSRAGGDDTRPDEWLLAACRREGLPVVLLERNLCGRDRPLAADLVAADELDGVARATRHLLGRGRKRVALVVGSPAESHADRVAGYLYALHADARHAPVVIEQDAALPPREAAARLADRVRKDRIDGVMCDAGSAAGLVAELAARGLAVPADVGVVGFGDLPSDPSAVPLTTYTYPADALAAQAVRLMRARLADPDGPPVKVVVPGRLVVRASSGGAE